MRLGFTGPKVVPAEAVDACKLHVSTCALGAFEFTTGACIGFDALAAHLLLDERPEAVHRLIVPADRSRVDVSIVGRFAELVAQGWTNVGIEFMELGTTYKQRNQRIVHYSDGLCAVTMWPETDGRSRRSGSWQTIRLARAAGIEPAHFDLSEHGLAA